MSWRTAPVGEVTTPTVRTIVGSGRFRASAKRPSVEQTRLQRLERALEIPHPHEIEGVDVKGVPALRREDADGARGHDPQARASAATATASRLLAHSIASRVEPASLSVK